MVAGCSFSLVHKLRRACALCLEMKSEPANSTGLQTETRVPGLVPVIERKLRMKVEVASLTSKCPGHYETFGVFPSGGRIA
jgi:hypothetical protein